MSREPAPSSRQASAEEEARHLRDEIAMLKSQGAADRRTRAKINSLEAQLQRKAQKVALYREIDARKERFDRPVGLLEGDLSDGEEAWGLGSVGADAGVAKAERGSAASPPPGPGDDVRESRESHESKPAVGLPEESFDSDLLLDQSSSDLSLEPKDSGASSQPRDRHASDVSADLYFLRIQNSLLHGTGVYTQREVRELLGRPRDFLTHFKMPAALYRRLRHYQQEGVKWLLSLYHMGRCGLLADEPGLGKTVQAIAFLLSLFLTGAVREALLVSPATLMHQWASELNDWAPFVRTVVFSTSLIAEASARAPTSTLGLRPPERSWPAPGGRGVPLTGTGGVRYAAVFDSLVADQERFYRVFYYTARDVLLGLGRGTSFGGPSATGEPSSKVSRGGEGSRAVGSTDAGGSIDDGFVRQLIASLRQHAGTVYICSYEFACRNSTRLGAFFERLGKLDQYYSALRASGSVGRGGSREGPQAGPSGAATTHQGERAIPCAIFDEIHYLKNADSNRSKTLRSLPAAFKIGLSGTPIQNDFSELYALLNFLSPGLLGDPDSFKRKFDWPIKAGSYAEASVESIRRAITLSTELYGIIRPYLLRRLKIHVEKELPSKTEYLVWCKLGAEQERIYCTFLDTDDGVQRVRRAEAAGQKSRFMEREAAKRYRNLRLTKLVEMQQICDHPLLLRVHRLSAGRPVSESLSGSRARLAQRGPPSRPTKRSHTHVVREGENSLSDGFEDSQSSLATLSDDSRYLENPTDSNLSIDSGGSDTHEGGHCDTLGDQRPLERQGTQGLLRSSGEPKNHGREDHPSAAAIDFAMSSKLMWLQAALRNKLKTAGNLRPGEKALIFCQGQKMLGIVEALLLTENIGFVRMDGSTPIEARESLVERFSRSPECTIFLLTTRVGGLGLNLVAARKVYVVNPSWNPAIDDQAMDRCWRIKQTGAVEVYRLLTAGTVEERMYNRQVYKKAMSNKLLENVLGARGTMSKSDLYNLFQYTPPRQNFVVELVHVFNGHDQTGNIILDNLPEGLRKRVVVRKAASQRKEPPPAAVEANTAETMSGNPGNPGNPMKAAQEGATTLPTRAPLGYVTFVDLAEKRDRLDAYLAESLPEIFEKREEGLLPTDSAANTADPGTDEPVALFDLVGEKLDGAGEASRVAQRILEFLAESKTNDASTEVFDTFFEERVHESFLPREDLEKLRDSLVMHDTGRGLYYVRRGVRKAILE